VYPIFVGVAMGMSHLFGRERVRNDKKFIYNGCINKKSHSPLKE